MASSAMPGVAFVSGFRNPPAFFLTSDMQAWMPVPSFPNLVLG